MPKFFTAEPKDYIKYQQKRTVYIRVLKQRVLNIIGENDSGLSIQTLINELVARNIGMRVACPYINENIYSITSYLLNNHPNQDRGSLYLFLTKTHDFNERIASKALNIYLDAIENKENAEHVSQPIMQH